jgi:outer membrane usher protein
MVQRILEHVAQKWQRFCENNMRHHRKLQHGFGFIKIERTLMILIGVLLSHPGWADPAASPTKPLKFMLEVHINDQPTNLIAEFLRDGAGRFSAKRAELRDLGIAVTKGKADDIIALDSLPGIALRYDEPGQKLFLDVTPEMRLAKDYSANDLRGLITQENIEPSKEFGSVLNYNLYGTATRGYSESRTIYRTGSVTIDHRAFSPFGMVQNTAIAGTTLTKKGVLRLDSSFVFAHPESMIVATAGDVISSGLNWTRPVRLGGGQISRQFSLQPGLVTAPLPGVSGSAAVPSTVDVFVDNVRIASRDVGAGPFRLNDLPVPGESGTARVVIRDVTGRETVTSLPFFTSSKLLAAGQFDFSLDGGVPRYNYAIESFDYGRAWVGMATSRYGITDRITVEGHVEGARGLANGGLGLTFGAANWGVFSFAGAGSWYRESKGGLVHASWQETIKGIFVGLSTQRSFGDYQDVASVTVRPQSVGDADDLADSGFFVLNRSSKLPRAIDRLTFGLPITSWNASLAASLINIERVEGDRSRLLSLTYSQTFAKKYNTYIAAYADLHHKNEAAITAGLSFQFKDDLIINTALTKNRETSSAGVEIMRPLGTKSYDYGWRLHTVEGANPLRGASGTYRNPWSMINAGIRQDPDFVGGYAELDGAIVATSSGVWPTRRVQDAFAVVDTGAPGIEVLHENRPVGKTNWFGKIVVPDLQSFQRSKIAISPETVPGGTYLTMTETDVIPGYRGGTSVAMKNIEAKDTARIQIKDDKNEPLPVGSIVTLKETGATFSMGYDGQIFIPGIGDQNTLLVKNGDKSCEVSFARADRKGVNGRVGPLICAGG